MDYIIIVAGGKGLRMGGDIPKQFLPIAGVPVLMRTILRFREALPEVNVILVLPKAQQDYWKELCQQHQFNEDYQLADGGQTRFHSVQNGLALIPDDAEGIVGVHDGVRPFVAVETILRCYEEARSSKAVVPVIPVVETLRKINAENRAVTTSHPSPLPSHLSPLPSPHPSHTVPRDEYRLVQTPQCFDIQLLKAANRQPYCDAFTDDASVVEAYGQSVTLVDGNRENIKITTPADLKIAVALFNS